MSPSCGEPLKELIAEQNVQADCSQVQPTVQHVKARKTHFLKWDPISNKGDKEENLGNGTEIHHGSSEESNKEL